MEELLNECCPEEKILVSKSERAYRCRKCGAYFSEQELEEYIDQQQERKEQK